MKLFWIIAIIVLSLIEVSTVNLVTIWFIISAVISLILSFLNISFFIQFLVFVVLGTLLLIFSRKPLLKLVNKTKTKTNVDRILDMTGIVIKTIDKDIPGEVKVDGKIWRALSNKKIETNAKVKILRIEGTKLFVMEEN